MRVSVRAQTQKGNKMANLYEIASAIMDPTSSEYWEENLQSIESV